MAARADLKTVISADMSGFSATMRRAGMVASSTSRAIGRGMVSATRAVGRLAAAAVKAAAAAALIGGALAGAAMVRGLKGAADLGGKMSDLAAQTGIAAGSVALLTRAFEDNNVSGDKVGAVINKMQKAIYEASQGAGSALPAFAALGLDLAKLSKMSPDKQFQAIQRAISSIEDPTKRAAMAMQIFGKSGGELLTLFADTGAFENSGKFLGTQAEILNRSAGIFDAISDKLGRVPAKLQGFFVGFLEPISGLVNGLLDKFEAFDFAAVGLRLGESFMRAVEMVRGAIDALSLGEMFSLAGSILKVKFMEAGNELWKIISAVMAMFKSGEIGSAFETAALKFKSILLEAAAEIADSLAAGAGGKTKTALENAAHFARGSAAVADAQREAIEESGKGEKSMAERFKEEREKTKDIFKIPDEDIAAIQEGFQKIRVAADQYSSSRKDAADEEARRFAGGAGATGASGDAPRIIPVDATTFGPDRSMMKAPEQFGPPRALMNRMRGFGEAARPSSRMFGQNGGIGSDNVFAKDRERMGIGSGLVTGGLGEKRRLNTSADNKDAKKNLSLQEKQVDHLEQIESKLGEALTVN